MAVEPACSSPKAVAAAPGVWQEMLLATIEDLAAVVSGEYFIKNRCFATDQKLESKDIGH